MIKMRCAYTTEIDDVEVAVGDVVRQLDLENCSFKNAVGLVHCYSEYIETGVVKALYERLPFEVIGCTTTSGACRDEGGNEVLIFTMLYSDDVSFSTAMSETITAENIERTVMDTHARAKSKLGGDPSFIMAFFPLMGEVSGGQFLEKLDEISGGIPIFGTVSCDHSVSGREESQTICNDQAHQNTAALLLMKGDVNAKFTVIALPEHSIQQQKGIVTDSEGYVVKSVNGLPLLEYLESLGMHTEDLKWGPALASPFMVDYEDGTRPVALLMYGVTPEGDGVYGGSIPTGAGVTLGSLNREGILQTTQESLGEIMKVEHINGILAYSCRGRYFILSPDFASETRIVRKFSGDVPFMFSYSGGEICPVYSEDGKLKNRFHNYTLIACVFS
ncbi:MAG: FIST C-terminal domain-containing protein [Synergistaceae bacterium]|jgi:hypothetical protein|nr:FIST C-terminal domain-containing protein [Synergistaceae bacterium]